MGGYHTGFVKETGALMSENRTGGWKRYENGTVSNLKRESGESDEHKLNVESGTNVRHTDETGPWMKQLLNQSCEFLCSLGFLQFQSFLLW